MAARAEGLRLLFLWASLGAGILGQGTVHTNTPFLREEEHKQVTLSCIYSGFQNPNVVWKFGQGGNSVLVCYNNKITAPYEQRVTFSAAGITFKSVTRKDNGTYVCMVSDPTGASYAEATIYLTVLVPPAKPRISVPSSATIGRRVVLTCSEDEGSPPSEYQWLRDGLPVPPDPKSSRIFSNSSYTMNLNTGELIFDPLSASDSGEYSCRAQNGVGLPQQSNPMRMEATELNVGGIVAAVIVSLILLGLLAFGVWFAYSRGYFNRTKKESSGKKVIYSQPSARSDGEFKQTSSFLV
ncbi:junctional adhesion molecule A [Tachyglossus aculeatus]|uniref:junctional adhesion molecule A n=1 Tax=Tachyglossus aculeatus TaxID=9261 RepID=UPI0018F4AF5E|nr:junctional adhesion molecule A [Tachyglossus aculeatus]